MAGELKHADPGGNLTHAEYVAPSGAGGHTVESGAVGDLLYYNGTAIVRIPIGTVGQFLVVVGGIPSWQNFNDVSYPLQAPDGTAAAPSYSYLLSPNAGWYSSGVNVITASTASTARWSINATGHLIAFTDNSFDIGAAGATRPRSIFVGTNVTVGGQVIAADGSAGAPAYSYTNDPNSGIFLNGVDTNLGVSINGTVRILLGNTLILHQNGFLSWGSSGVGSNDLFLARDAANVLAQRNGVNGQAFRLYNTYTDSSNYERLTITWLSTANTLIIQTQQGGTGTARNLSIGTSGAASLVLRSNDTARWLVNSSGHLLANVDDTYDFGAAGATRARTLYVATSVVVPSIVAAASGNVALVLAAAGTSLINLNSGTYSTIQSYSPGIGGTATLACQLGDIHFINMPAGNITIALANPQAGQILTIRILQDGVGSRTVTWFTTIRWVGGVAPTLTTTPSKADVITIVTTGAGTYDGFVSGQDI